MAAAAAARWPRFFVLRPAAALLLLLLLLLLHATAASPTTESGAGNATVARPDPCCPDGEKRVPRFDGTHPTPPLSQLPRMPRPGGRGRQYWSRPKNLTRGSRLM
uniref:Uncharacterized protein n=1 Tax=Oryza rufipogon TaxID=4529 RepID=A0A0E0NBI1_ORYRU